MIKSLINRIGGGSETKKPSRKDYDDMKRQDKRDWNIKHGVKGKVGAKRIRNPYTSNVKKR